MGWGFKKLSCYLKLFTEYEKSVKKIYEFEEK
jgi:hypothetical protein